MKLLKVINGHRHIRHQLKPSIHCPHSCHECNNTLRSAWSTLLRKLKRNIETNIVIFLSQIFKNKGMTSDSFR